MEVFRFPRRLPEPGSRYLSRNVEYIPLLKTKILHFRNVLIQPRCDATWFGHFGSLWVTTLQACVCVSACLPLPVSCCRRFQHPGISPSRTQPLPSACSPASYASPLHVTLTLQHSDTLRPNRSNTSAPFLQSQSSTPQRAAAGAGPSPSPTPHPSSETATSATR